MFETSVVQAQTRVAARSRLGLLATSIVAHTAVILGAVAISVASVDFPNAAPNEIAMFKSFDPPPPLGTPDGGGAKPAVTPPQQKPATPPPAPNVVTAPPAIPDETPTADPSSTPSDASALPGDAATGPGGGNPGPIGVPWGDPHGVGDLNAPPATNPAPAVEEKIYQVGGEVKAPVAIYKTQPAYPNAFVRARMRATVVVRCIIDKNGHVRDPQVIVGAAPPFNEAVINAVTQWRFQPGSYRGVAVDTYLDLTVNFAIK